jgi:hypothetical protein
MKRYAMGTIGAFAWVALLGAQSRSPQVPKSPAVAAPQAQEITLTGCVVEGSSADVFILDRAVERPGSTEKPRTFRLIGGGEDLDLMQHLNQQVQATGTAEVKPTSTAPPTGPATEKNLPTFTVRSIETVGDRCTN